MYSVFNGQVGFFEAAQLGASWMKMAFQIFPQITKEKLLKLSKMAFWSHVIKIIAKHILKTKTNWPFSPFFMILP